MRFGLGATLTMPLVLLACCGTALAKGATITAEPFTDSCRDATFHSTKEISHVEIHYADGSVLKDESIASPHHAIDGGVGDEIDHVVVKSGTTSQTFTCIPTPANSPPTAVLELDVPPGCVLVNAETDAWHCGSSSVPRTEWLDASAVGFGCSGDTSLCDLTSTFRGTSSTDPDGDITSWSIDFGDGTSTSGGWATDPPTGEQSGAATSRTVTLTVTDSAGQSDTDTMTVTFTFED